jgi:hypothetical protein
MRRTTLLLPAFLLSIAAQDTAQTALEHAREVNLERAAKLPHFIADESVKRYKSPHTNPPQWKYVDTIESEIAVQGSGFTRRHPLLNGKPWTKAEFPNFNWSVQFGDELNPLFGPKCQTPIEFDKRDDFRGKPVLAYRFASPPNGCFGGLKITSGMFGLITSTKYYSPKWTGRFLIDDPGGNVVLFEAEAHEFPKGFGQDPVKQTGTWDYVKIGDLEYLLPVSTEIFGGFTKADLWHVVVEYKNHRHFESATEIQFK